MNVEDRKRLEEINNAPGSGHPARCTCIWCVDRLWLITHLDAEAQENERLRQELVETHAGWSKTNDMRIQAESSCQSLLDWMNPSVDILEARHVGRLDREEEIEELAQENERLRQELLDRRVAEMDRLENLTNRAEAAEATYQSLLEQNSRWEAQALEAEVRVAELEALFALQQTRMAEATEAWRKATGKYGFLPDLGDLLAWLMDRPAAAPLELLREAGEELQRAQQKHAPMHGAHEGYAVILEELDELWNEVKAQTHDKARMRKEALQVAAMALRFIADVCDAHLSQAGEQALAEPQEGKEESRE